MGLNTTSESQGATVSFSKVKALQSQAPTRMKISPSLAMTFGVCAFLYFLRAPEAYLHANLWAEDGSAFFLFAYNEPKLETLILPSAGYLHLIPRLLALGATFVPIAAVAVVLNIAAGIFQLLPILYMLSHRSNQLLPDMRQKIALSLVYTCLPGTWESHASITNIQWTLPVLLILLLFSEAPNNRCVRIFEWILAALASTSGPFAIFCLLAYGTCCVLWRRFYRNDVAFILLIGGMIQTFYILHSARMATSLPWTLIQWPEAIQLTLLKSFYYLLFGMHDFSKHLPNMNLLNTWILYIPALFVTLLVIFEIIRQRQLLAIALLIVGGAVIFSFAKSSPNLAGIFPFPDQAIRYFYLMQAAFATSMVILAWGTSAWSRALARVLLLSILIMALPSDFHNVRAQPPLPSWREQIEAKFHPLPQGGIATMQIHPMGWEFGLVKRGP